MQNHAAGTTRRKVCVLVGRLGAPLTVRHSLSDVVLRTRHKLLTLIFFPSARYVLKLSISNCGGVIIGQEVQQSGNSITTKSAPKPTT